MANDSDEAQLAPAEEEGGPVKSFLEHLEDLRWTLIKGGAAIFVGVIICLLGGPYVMRVLMWPLERSGRYAPARQSVEVRFGTNRIGTFYPGTNRVGSLDLRQVRWSAIQLVPVRQGTNQFLGLQLATNPPDADADGSPVQLLNLSPAGGFFVAFQLAIYGGIVLAAPFVIYFIAQFVLPALKINEKRYILRGFGIGAGLFLCGVCFCYFILMPVALHASMIYATWYGLASNQWRAEEYISFVCKFMLGMGLGFELPVVLLTLVRIGILDYATLASMRRYMIVINLILGAFLTTPEVITQILMAVPLQLLFEITVWIAWYWERQEKKRQSASRA